MCPRFDPERIGIKLVGSPRHADIILATGAVTKKSRDAVKKVYDQVPEPKVVVGIGNCAISGECFRNCYGIEGPLDKVIPVDVYVPGCPPRPQAIISGILKAIKILGDKK